MFGLSLPFRLSDLSPRRRHLRRRQRTRRFAKRSNCFEPSLPDLVSFLSDIQSKNVDLYLHQQGLDTSTPSGRMMFQMLSVFAEFERAMIRERILAGLRRTTKKSGRKPMPEDRVEAIRRSLRGGLGIRATARLHRASATTVTAIARALKTVQEDRLEHVVQV